MSYPKTIQALIIEDDIEAKRFYDEVFASFIEAGDAAPPRYAFCLGDAEIALREERIYHLIILDLRLPDAPGKPPMEGLEYGTTLLQQCIERDAYPVAALLVISGHLGQADQGTLTEQVNSGFAYGRIIVKGPGSAGEIQEAVEWVKRYCAVSLHGRDMGTEVYPPLSPREEDLLRRCVLQQVECEGIDFQWWSAEYERPTGSFAAYGGWTKTLMGNFLMGGMGVSHPTFFKIAPAIGSDVVLRDASILHQKLPHIKRCCALASGSRSLLVTQKVGASRNRPLSLSAYLTIASAEDPQTPLDLARIAADIASQVAMLGSAGPNLAPASQLLWAHHNDGKLLEQWERWGGAQVLQQIGNGDDLVGVLSTLRSNPTALRFISQTCLHGDLNCTNVALDTLSEGVRAYICDASGCRGGVNVRDLAMLEVTTLLHEAGEEELVHFCQQLYIEQTPLPTDLHTRPGSNKARNTFRLILEIRKQALKRSTRFIYSLMVFDNALMQLGGLSFSPNKIARREDAVLLSALSARWLLQLWPSFEGD